MFQAKRGPRYCAKSLLFYRAAIDQALAKRAFLNSLQRISYLVERRQIDIRFLKLPIFFFVSDTRIAPVTRRRLVAQIARVCVRALDIFLIVVVLPPVGVACILLYSRLSPWFHRPLGSAFTFRSIRKDS